MLLCASSASSLRQSRPCSLSTSSRGLAAPNGLLLRGLGAATAAAGASSPPTCSVPLGWAAGLGSAASAVTTIGSTGFVRGASCSLGRPPADGADESERRGAPHSSGPPPPPPPPLAEAPERPQLERPSDLPSAPKSPRLLRKGTDVNYHGAQIFKQN